MNRFQNGIQWGVILLTLLLFSTSGMASPAERLIGLGRVLGGVHHQDVVLFEVDLNGPAVTEISTVTNGSFIGNPSALEYDGVNFFMATWEPIEKISRIYQIEESNGDASFEGISNVGLISNLMKHPVTDQIYATFDSTVHGLDVDSFGVISTDTAQVQLSSLQGLKHPAWTIGGAAFDPLGNLVVGGFSGVLHFTYQIDPVSGVFSPLCALGWPCRQWQLSDGFPMKNIAIHPDTGQGYYSNHTGQSVLFYSFETVGSGIQIEDLGSVPGYFVIDYTYIPNIQSEEPVDRDDTLAAQLCVVLS